MSIQIAYMKEIIVAIKELDGSIFSVFGFLIVVSIVVLVFQSQKQLESESIRGTIYEMYNGIDLSQGKIPLMFFPVW